MAIEYLIAYKEANRKILIIIIIIIVIIYKDATTGPNYESSVVKNLIFKKDLK